MPFQPPPSFLDEVESVARAGADGLMPYWRSLDASQIDEKSRNDLVTVADRASETAILDAIGRRYPDHAVLAEESGWTRRDDSRPTWIVDPLDGTTNFVHGIPQFAVSVAVAVSGRVDYGVIFDPVKDDLFRASRDGGATWNGRRCRVTRRDSLDGAVIATGFPFKAHELLDPYLAIFREVFLRCKAIRRPGAAALDLAYTAAGLFDGFFEFRLSPWDVAAGALLVEEAGGAVSDMDGGDDFLSSGDMLCGTAGVHAELLDIVRPHRASWSAETVTDDD